MGKSKLHGYRNQELIQRRYNCTFSPELPHDPHNHRSNFTDIKNKHYIPHNIRYHINSNFCVRLRIDISEILNILPIRNMSEFPCISRCNNWQRQEKIFGRDVIQIVVQNKIMFYYTLQFVSILNKGTLIFLSHFVLYLTLLTFPLHTQNKTNKKFN